MRPKKKKRKDVQFMTDTELEADAEDKRKAEQERLERERLLKKTEEELKRAIKEKKKREGKEMVREKLRNLVLKKNCSDFESFFGEHLTNRMLRERREKVWSEYANCNHLPLPNDPPGLNTYLFGWKSEVGELSYRGLLKELEKLLETLIAVREYTEDPLDLRKDVFNNLTEVKMNYFKEMINAVDKVTFDAIMKFSKYHRRANSQELEILNKTDNFFLWVWGWAVGQETHEQSEKKRPTRKTPLFNVTLPAILGTKRYHMRVLHTTYDPFSFQTASYIAPDFDAHNLLEETIKIRDMEVKALKNRYANGYDEEAMPWWFLTDEEIIAETERIEMLKETAENKRKKVVETKVGEGVENMHPSDLDKQPEMVSDLESSKFTWESEEQNENVEKKLNKCQEELKERHTKILYSRSMTELMEARKKDYRESPSISVKESWKENPIIRELRSDLSKEKEDKILKSETNTTFREYFDRGITKIVPSSKSLNGELAFSDSKIIEDEPVNEDAILYGLEELMFSNNQPVLENGEINYVKRDTQLRSINELFKDMALTKSGPGFHNDLKTKITKQGTTSLRNFLKSNVKVTNVNELKALELEISNVLKDAWMDYTNDYRRKFAMKSDPYTINLREYAIVGGVYIFEFFQGEPQFYEDGKINMRIRQGEHSLKRVEFAEAPVERIDLAVEVERRVTLAVAAWRQRLTHRKSSRAISLKFEEEEDLPEADDDLVWIKLNLPRSVLFTEGPTPVRWDDDSKCWTTEHTFGVKWKPKENACKFKLGKSGPFALAVSRFLHLPFVGFHLRPSGNWKEDPSVSLELTTRNFGVDFLVRGALVEVARADASCDLSHLAAPGPVSRLVRSFRAAGLDLFPGWDSSVFVRGALSKLRALEEHMYRAMGKSAPSFEYKEAPLNGSRPFDEVLFEMRESVEEVEGSRPPWRTVSADTKRAAYVTFSRRGTLKEENGSIGFRPDLVTFIEGVASPKAYCRMKKASKLTITTVVQLLTATKVLSYT